MTIRQAIDLADEIRPSELSGAIKLHWLSALDGELQTDLFSQYEQAPDTAAPYDADTDPGTALLVDWPFDDLYVRYLVMCTDLANGDLERYNNDAVYYNRILRSFVTHYARTHTPKAVQALVF